MVPPTPKPPSLAIGSDLGLMLALRPVYTRSLHVIAYDPVFRTLDGTPVSVDDYLALGLVLSEGYGGVLDKGPRVPFHLRISLSILEQVELPFLPPEHFVLEVVPAPTHRSAELERFRQLADDGYAIAVGVDEVALPHLESYLDFASSLRLDANQVRAGAANRLLDAAGKRGLPLVATDIASKDDFDALADLGFTGFSGEVFGRPARHAGVRLTAHRMLLLELLVELRDANASLRRIEDLVARDPGLTLRILTLVNSAAVGSRREVTSVGSALQLVGVAELRRWVSLLLLSNGRGVPLELMRATLVRARMCELVALGAGYADPDTYFLTGLLSTIDLITGVPMPVILEQVPLGDGLKAALLRREGDRGRILLEVARYQDGLFPDEGAALPLLHYEPLYRQSTAWAKSVLDSL